MIESEIIEEIINTSLNQRFLSKKQIFKFAKKIIETLEDSTKNRFQEIYFGSNYWDDPEFATTDIKNGIINFNMDTVYSNFKERNRIIDSYLTCNLEILQLLLHEIQHLREPYKMMQNKLDNTLIGYGSIKYMQERYGKMYPNMPLDIFQKKYLRLYNFIPTERIAEIDSYKELFNSILNFPDFKEKNKIEFSIIKQAYIINNTGVYDRTLSPLNYYFRKIKRYDLLDRFDKEFIESLSLEDKLRAGLKTDKEDIKKFEKTINAK